MKKGCMLILAFFIGTIVIAGELLKKRVSVNYTNETIEKIILDLAKNYDLNFFYSNKITELQKRVSINLQDITLKECLEHLFHNSTVRILEVDGQIVLKQKKNFTISGYIENVDDGEKLIGANIYETRTKKGTASNVYGFYSLTLPKGKQELQFSFIGHQSKTILLNLANDTLMNVLLTPSLNLKEVEIIANNGETLRASPYMGNSDISVDKIEGLPVLLGEKDVLKTMQLLPGIQSGIEGASSMYVRGGGPDQNLLLLDGVPLYNPSHLFGFFSIFNADAVNNVSVYKGSFPARYGGRLSSVVDIRLKEGNKKQFRGAGSIGLASAKIALDGPVFSEKTSFIISARRSYIDALSVPISKHLMRKNGYEGAMGYYFYDFHGKINHQFSLKDRIYLSGFLGKDKFFYKYVIPKQFSTSGDNHKLLWGNAVGSIRWNHVFNSRLFSNVTINYSRYKLLLDLIYRTNNQNGSEKIDDGLTYYSGIENWAGKWEMDFFPSTNHQLKFGIGETYHMFYPGTGKIKNIHNRQAIDTTFGNEQLFSNELFVFAEDEIILSKDLKINLGVHGSAFLVENKNYFSIQPRFSGRYLLTTNLSIKGSYTYTTQYLHLLSNPTIGAPTDLWVPATKNIPPQNAHLAAFGIASSVLNFLELSIEAYYKKMTNLIEYKDGTSFLLASNWQNKVELGKGWAYGLEFLVEKKTGKTSGWIGYTLSKTQRQFNNINLGETFPYRYDRRHDISLAVTHKLSKKIDIGATWTFGTGKAVTLGTETYFVKITEPHLPDGRNDEVTNITGRNNFREPVYHRLDVGINFRKEKKWGERTWNISFYNAYNRQNPFYLYLKKEYSNNKSKLYQMSIFPIIPSVSYSFKF